MQEIQPHRLTTTELLRLAYATGYDKLPPAWIAELVKRLESTLDNQR